MKLPESLLYIAMIGLLGYYLYIANLPRQMYCKAVNEYEQTCIVTNYLGE